MFVHPSQVADIARRHAAIVKCRVVVDRDGSNDSMVFKLEVASGDRSDALAGAIGESIQTIAKLRGSVTFVDPGSLPNDGKVIEDLRKLE